MARRPHDCLKHREERRATLDRPYRFSDSGLPNVFLVGIKCFQCKKCGEEVAEIPAIKDLMSLIARDLVGKREAFTGAEIRFLRKRLGKKASDFAREIGVSPEYLSRVENDHESAGEGLDKLIRLTYAVASKDETLLNQLKKALHELLASWIKTRKPKRIVARVKDNVWTPAVA